MSAFQQDFEPVTIFDIKLQKITKFCGAVKDNPNKPHLRISYIIIILVSFSVHNFYYTNKPLFTKEG